MPPPRFPIPQGTLDMLILQVLSLEPAHGYGIAQRLEQVFQEDLKHSQRVTYEQWRSRSLYERVMQFFAFPIKEQL